jgi:hypothetical protein
MNTVGKEHRRDEVIKFKEEIIKLKIISKIRKQGSKEARKQGSKEARKQGSKA